MSEATHSATNNSLVLEERAGAVATLRMNRPERLNALNVELGRALVDALAHVANDPSIRAVVLTGAGRGFCAGGDLALLHDVRKRNAGPELEKLLLAGKEICLSICDMPKPVVAAVNGPAAGGGMNLALACDIRIASDQASFCEAFARLGLYPDFGGTYYLPQLVGIARAAELFYSAEMLSAADALRLGIVSRVVPHDRLEAETRALAERLAAAPPVAVRSVKRSVVAGDRAALECALDEEIINQMKCFHSEDCLEGLEAFLAKRQPSFQGR
jgi:2-(1,2-epoxy-1,2-dihydrophenyl)acetyl-CoA isomerase